MRSGLKVSMLLPQEVVLSPTAVSYNMAQLSASTEYSVKLQAIAGPKRSRVIMTVFTTSEFVMHHKCLVVV